jgi:CMP-N-acetylneuraminic acid synthetase
MEGLTFAVIYARGGSKRLPHKNTRPFCGISIVGWAIIQATCSHLIDGVFVNTDDDEIEEIAKSFGANIIRRPDWPEPEKVSSNRPILNSIQELRKLFGDNFKRIIPIQVTQPLNKPEDFDNGIRYFDEYGCDVMGPMINSRETVILKKTSLYRARSILFDKKYNYLTQGPNWIVTRPNWFAAYCENLKSDFDEEVDKFEEWPIIERNFFPVECWQFPDVDTEVEFELGELLMNHYILKGRGPSVYYEYAVGKEKEMITVPRIDCRISDEDKAEIESETNRLLREYGGNLNQL